MTLRGIILGCLVMLVLMAFEPPDGACQLSQCHDNKCTHFVKKFGQSTVILWSDRVTHAAVVALKGLGSLMSPQGQRFAGTPYRAANHLIYFIILPTLAVLIAWFRRERWWLYVTAGVLFCVVLGVGLHYESGPGQDGLYAFARNFALAWVT